MTGLEIKPDEFDVLWQHLGKTLKGYLSQLPESNAYYDPGSPRQLLALPPAFGTPFPDLVQEFLERATKRGIEATSGNFFGYVPGGGLAICALAEALTAITNRYSGVAGASPGAAEIENECIHWLVNLLELPKTAFGTLQSGGTLATACAVVAFRQATATKDPHRIGIFATDQVHNCIDKAIRITGLDAARRVKILTDGELRMDPQSLGQLLQDHADLEAAFVVASVGTTNTGAVDPIPTLRQVLKNHQGPPKTWLHADAAYGGFFALTPSGQHLKEHLQGADSIVLDPHKGLFLPYGCGAVLVRDGAHLKDGFSFTAAYLADAQKQEKIPSPADYSPELTRHFRAMRLWMALKFHGTKAFAEGLEEKLLLAQNLYHDLEQDGYEMGPVPELSCVTFRQPGTPDEPTEILLDKLLHKGRVHVSSTRFKGKLWLRACILCFRSHDEHTALLRKELNLART